MSPESAQGSDYRKVVKRFQKRGFTFVGTTEVPFDADRRLKFLNPKSGTVAWVSVDGDQGWSADRRYRTSAYVVVAYYAAQADSRAVRREISSEPDPSPTLTARDHLKAKAASRATVAQPVPVTSTPTMARAVTPVSMSAARDRLSLADQIRKLATFQASGLLTQAPWHLFDEYRSSPQPRKGDSPSMSRQ